MVICTFAALRVKKSAYHWIRIMVLIRSFGFHRPVRSGNGNDTLDELSFPSLVLVLSDASYCREFEKPLKLAKHTVFRP